MKREYNEIGLRPLEETEEEELINTVELTHDELRTKGLKDNLNELQD